MRLDFRNIGKGLEAVAGAKQARDLAQESARFDVTEGAYGPGLQENIQQLQGLRAQDPAQANAYDQAIGELTRRSAMTAPDFSVASGPTNVASRQEARQAAAPMRAEGLAGVYRRYGDVEQADALETRAFEQQRGLAQERRAQTAEERAAGADVRAQTSFETQQTEAGLRLKGLERTEVELQRASDFAEFAAERPEATVTELKDAAFKQFKFTPKQWQDTVTTRLGIENAEMDSFKNSVKKKMQGKNLSQVGELYNSDPDFDDKTDLAIVPGKNGAVTLNFIDKDSKTVTESQTFKNQALALEFLNKQATEPETIGSWMINLQKAESGLAKDAAAIRASDRSGIRAPDINEYVDAQGNVTLIDVGALPRDRNNQPILPQGLRKLPTGSATTKDLTPQQQRAFDALKNTDAFKSAVERGNQVRVRELLIANNIPPETFFGAAALPPGDGGGTARNPFDEPDEPPKPARPAAASRAEQPPSPAQLRYLRERSVGVLTPRGQLEAAANAGNPAALQELERRVAGEEDSAQRNFENTQRQMRGLQ